MKVRSVKCLAATFAVGVVLMTSAGVAAASPVTGGSSTANPAPSTPPVGGGGVLPDNWGWQ